MTLPFVLVAAWAGAGAVVWEKTGVGETSKADTKPARTKLACRVIDVRLYTIPPCQNPIAYC
jgi:hypothetical protein